MFVDHINEPAEGRAAGNGLGGIDGCWGGCPASLLPATLAFLIRAPQGPSGSGLSAPRPSGPHPASQPLTPSCPRHSSGCWPRTRSRSAGGAEVSALSRGLRSSCGEAVGRLRRRWLRAPPLVSLRSRGPTRDHYLSEKVKPGPQPSPQRLPFQLPL